MLTPGVDLGVIPAYPNTLRDCGSSHLLKEREPPPQKSVTMQYIGEKEMKGTREHFNLSSVGQLKC